MREIKRRNQPRGYFGDDDINDVVYAEIDAALERLKDRAIEDVLSQDRIVLDDAAEAVANILEDCSRTKRLFEAFIYTGDIPEELMDYEEEDDDSDWDDDDDDILEEPNSDYVEEPLIDDDSKGESGGKDE